MKRRFILIVLGILVLAGSSCKRELIPEEELTGLHKPTITKISPAAILFNDAGFFLNVSTGMLEDDYYVLYINDRKIGQDVPGYWRTYLGWFIPKALISELLAASPEGVTCNVRITSINQSYDISDNFEKYSAYVSEPVALEIKKGETQFSAPKLLFPQWSHSREPIIRCDKQGNLYLAWQEKINGVYQAFFSFSRDAGANWSQVLNISRSTESVDKISLAVDDFGHFYMVWNYIKWSTSGVIEESNIFFNRSLDNGGTWDSFKQINAVGEISTTPVIDINDRGDVLLAWKRWDNGTVSDLRLASSRDLGKSWQNRDFAVPRSTDYWGEPVLACGTGGSVYLFSGKEGRDNKGFYFFYAHDYGISWQTQEVPTGDIYPFKNYSSARFGPENQIYFVWGESSTAGHTAWNGNYFLRRESSGDAWSEIQPLHASCRTVHEKAALAISGDRVDVVMTENGGLFLLRALAGGRSWPYPEFIPGTDRFLFFNSPDMVQHPLGKTFLVFLGSDIWTDGALYMMQFE
jgi:hypothetical protein